MRLLKTVYGWLYWAACRRRPPYEQAPPTFDIALGLVITEGGTVVPVFSDVPYAAEVAFRDALEMRDYSFGIAEKVPPARGAYYRLVKECEFERSCTVTERRDA